MIVPRWEWRTFGDDFGDSEAHFAGLPTERVQETDEIYLLSLLSDASVKVRGGLMDVKRLEQVANGLEQWRPVLRADFPLSAQEAGHVLEALGTGAAPSGRAAYDLAQLLDELVRPSPQLLAVEVHKVRRHYTVSGCRAEVSELRTDRGSRRTIAVESEDPGAVTAAVSGLGLSARPNVSVPRGLKALVGFGAKRYAVIDVGTNSVKFHIGERRADGEWQTLVDRAEVTRLGEGLEETGRLGDEPIERTVTAITAMADEARQLEVEAIAAVGTAGLRIASNSSAFVEAVRERAGVELEVVSGDEEGRLAYLAVESELDLGDGSLVVFDSGGGSAQFTFGRGGHVDERFSVDVGAVRITEQFGLDQAVSEDTLATALDEISNELTRLDDRPSPEVVVGLGGTVTNLAAVMHELATYDPDVVQGSVLDRAEIDRQIDVYRTRSADERREIVGLQPKRAEVILAGACIVRTVLEKLGCESLTVSDRGLRHGLLGDRFGSLESLSSKR